MHEEAMEEQEEAMAKAKRDSAGRWWAVGGGRRCSVGGKAGGRVAVGRLPQKIYIQNLPITACCLLPAAWLVLVVAAAVAVVVVVSKVFGDACWGFSSRLFWGTINKRA